LKPIFLASGLPLALFSSAAISAAEATGAV
jgi:hypothetical protein